MAGPSARPAADFLRRCCRRGSMAKTSRPRARKLAQRRAGHHPRSREDRQIPDGPPNKSISDALEEHWRLFAATLHPMELWASYWLCRKAKCQIPEWVLAEFDRLFLRLIGTVFEPSL